jgi:hypothetical protein
MNLIVSDSLRLWSATVICICNAFMFLDTVRTIIWHPCNSITEWCTSCRNYSTDLDEIMYWSVYTSTSWADNCNPYLLYLNSCFTRNWLIFNCARVTSVRWVSRTVATFSVQDRTQRIRAALWFSRARDAFCGSPDLLLAGPPVFLTGSSFHSDPPRPSLVPLLFYVTF